MYFDYSKAELERRIDLERKNTKSNFKKININLPWEIYGELAELARKNRLQRSQMVTTLCMEALRHEQKINKTATG